MRGPISLAAALSIPAAVGHSAGRDFETVLALTAAVIVTTLLGQGAVLPALVKLLHFSKEAEADRQLLRQQEILGETEAASAAFQRLAELESKGRISRDAAERLRRIYEDRLDEVSGGASPARADRETAEIRSELIAAERSRILALRNQGRISDYAIERLQRSLDLRESLIE